MGKNRKSKKTLAITGSIIGFVALTFAFLSPWVAQAIDPPPRPAEESIIDFAAKLKDAAAAKMSGQTYQGSVPDKVPSDYLPPIVIACGMLAVAFGVGSFLAGETKSHAACAVGLGVSAAIVQWSLILVVLVIVIVIVVAILAALGIDL